MQAPSSFVKQALIEPDVLHSPYSGCFGLLARAAAGSFAQSLHLQPLQSHLCPEQQTVLCRLLPVFTSCLCSNAAGGPVVAGGHSV